MSPEQPCSAPHLVGSSSAAESTVAPHYRATFTAPVPSHVLYHLYLLPLSPSLSSVHSGACNRPSSDALILLPSSLIELPLSFNILADVSPHCLSDGFALVTSALAPPFPFTSSFPLRSSRLRSSPLITPFNISSSSLLVHSFVRPFPFAARLLRSAITMNTEADPASYIYPITECCTY